MEDPIEMIIVRPLSYILAIVGWCVWGPKGIILLIVPSVVYYSILLICKIEEKRNSK